MRAGLGRFSEIWCVDFEFHAPEGENPRPICLVAIEYRSGRVVRLWEEDLARSPGPPFGTGPDSLVVAYYASAEMGCFLALGWPLPTFVLDLYPEFRCWTNGTVLQCGSGLLGAATYFGIDAMAAVEKESMRDLAMRGGPWTKEERRALLEYCEGDVRVLGRLLDVAANRVDLPRALLRGDYMKAAARMEWNGVPLDVVAHREIVAGWDGIRGNLIRQIDRDYGVFDGTTFKADRFEQWLCERGIPWPRLESGRLAVDDETFRQMARAHVEVAPLRELRVSLGEMRNSKLAIGIDGRNRCLLSAFRSKTGRNQPSNSRFIFGPAVWLRGLIRAHPDWALAYVDWSQQEFGIAAALSRDSAMLAAYESGDPYLEFAKQAGAVPPTATKRSHAREREQFKQCVLGVQYSMGEWALAQRIGRPVCEARALLEKHRRTYARFWRWSDACVDFAMLRGFLYTTYGWFVHVGGLVTPRSLMNFPMQANGAEMLRRACSLATTRGVRVCAPVHDAVLIEAPAASIDSAIDATRSAMAQASREVLDGLELRTDVKVFANPDRFQDERGARMWDTVMSELGRLRAAEGAVA